MPLPFSQPHKQWLAPRRRRRLRGGHGDTEDRVGAEPALVWRAIEVDQPRVDVLLLEHIESRHRARNFAVHVLDGAKHRPAEESAGIAIAQFQGLMPAGRSAGRHETDSGGAILEFNDGFDRRVAPAVEHLVRIDGAYFHKCRSPSRHADITSASSPGGHGR